MGSVERRLKALEKSWNESARDEEDARDERIRRTLTRRIVAEHARLKASGEGGDLIEKACLAVAHDQHDHLGAENCDYIGRAWAETMRGWSKLDWGTTTGDLHPPPGWG